MYDHKQTQSKIEEFWKQNQIYKKAKENNKDKKPFYYLDGPPYTSGKVHLGTAYGKVLRDAVLRYKRMQGFDVWDRTGFDMHGLPTEHATEKKLGIKDKDEIENFGVQRYIDECKKLSIENMHDMIKDFKGLGVWMDFDNPYMPITTEYIEGIWWLIKKAHENGRLYEGKRTMHWCAHCQTANAKHELEYKELTDQSIYLKFPVVGEPNTFLLIWTTTPWTISFNLAVMAGPDIDYIKAQVRDEVWIVAKELADDVIIQKVETGYTIREQLKGTQLEGLKYRHPLENKIPQFTHMQHQHNKLHTVILSKEFVNTESGTGLVHCAPGCGQEDYEVGHRNGLPPFNELKEDGRYKQSIPSFAGYKAKTDDNKFVEELKNTGKLIATTPIKHDYPTCWRCKEPVVFRTTKQWFFKVEDLKENMKEINAKTTWVPGWAGEQQFHNWLDNLRDNSITKQRYWGTPLPIWRNEETKEYIVIGSVEELKQYTENVPQDLHKPGIDKVILKKDGKEFTKIPDVLDVWVDAGCASWLCLDYPKRTDLFEKLFPADFILEGKDQIRGWFNILLVASMVALEQPSYKAVYMHGFINDSKGRKMSKSLQNYILPKEVTDEYGADTFRYYFLGAANPGVDVNYNFNDIKVKHRNLGVLRNIKRFLLQLADEAKYQGEEPQELDVEEKYIISKTNSTIKDVTELFDNYQLNEIPQKIEDLYLDLSRFYMQVTRQKQDKKKVAYTISYVLGNIIRLAAPMTPYTSEDIFQDLKARFNINQESIHLIEWPKANEQKIDKQIEQDINIAKQTMQTILAQREKVQLGIRWPLPDATIYVENQEQANAIKNTEEIIKVQTNIKEIKIEVSQPGLDTKIQSNVTLNTELTKELELEGFTRELTRLIQSLRKEAKMQKQDRVELNIQADIDITKNVQDLGEKVGATKINVGTPQQDYPHTKQKTIKGKTFTIALKKV